MAAVLALNCGSSSIRFGLFGPDGVAMSRGMAEGIGAGPVRLTVDGQPLATDGDSHATILPALIGRLAGRAHISAVGHRVVHGGTGFEGPALVTPQARAAIAALAPLAPSHQPHNLAGMDAVATALPGVPQVASFDTAFHRTIPEMRQRMPLPAHIVAGGLRRFGFHGLSCQWLAARLAEQAPAAGRAILCHLGNGCSLTGLVDGRSVWTTMGFTPLDGLVMGRRPGRLDPGAVLWLVEHLGSAAAVDRLLNREAGLAGVSGLSPDMRVLLASDSEDARLAVAMFVDRLVSEIGAAAAAIGGLDALVFSGGIGENAAPIRAMVLERLGWLGFALDENANAGHGPRVSTAGSRPALVIPTDEEAVIAAEARAVAGLR